MILKGRAFQQKTKNWAQKNVGLWVGEKKRHPEKKKHRKDAAGVAVKRIIEPITQAVKVGGTRAAPNLPYLKKSKKKKD